MSIKFTVTELNGEVVIQGTENEKMREIKLPKRVYNVLAACTSPKSNGDLQKELASAMGLSSPGGRCSKAASLLERYTHGYKAFNGWCALLIGTSEGRNRFFQFNPEFAVTEQKANMLTKTGIKLVNGEKPKKKEVHEDLDLPDVELSTTDMNAVIDAAYEKLGFNPSNLSDDAPDLTFEEASAIMANGGE